MQVPLARRAVRVRGAGPRAALEARDPSRGDLGSVLTFARVEPEALGLGRAGSGLERRLEPDVLVGHMVRDDVQDGPQAPRGGLGDERLSFLDGAEGGVDRAVVRDVVAAVAERGEIPR